jgi:sugar/nucleoside kinase (ribokinase family)
VDPAAGQPPTIWDVVGVGANSVDLVNVLPATPDPRVASLAKLRVRQQVTCCGGQVATAMAACAALGLKVKYVGATGSDDNGRRIREALAERAIDVSDVVTRDARNQFAVILLDDHTGERIVLWDRDERLALREAELPVGALVAARVIHVDDVDEETAIRAASIGRAAGRIVTSDLDRLTERTEELVAAVTVPILAEHLPPALTGEADQERALRKLRRRHDGLLVVTLGPGGAMALDGDRVCRAPAYQVEAVDTTGSGDVFRGGFILGLLRGWSVDEALRFANAAAAVTCTRLGAMNGVPAMDEVTRMADGGTWRTTAP